MAAESPTTERDIFSYDRSSTPPPTTSSYIPRHEPALLPKIDKENEPDDKDKEDKDKDDKDKDGALGPGANPGYKKDEAIEKADRGRKDDKGDDKGYNPDKKLNGTDGLDGKWIPPPPPSKDDDDEEDQCVKCLYYAMQCCECTIL